MSTDPSSDPIILPQVALQHDFTSVFADIRDNTVFSEDIFLSCYQLGLRPVHGKVNASHDESVASPDGILLESRDGVELTRLDSHTFTASCPALSIVNTILRAPRQGFSINPIENTTNVRRISAFDVTSNAALIAIGHYDGTITIQSVSTPSDPEAQKFPLTTKKLHLSSVLSLRFFPSNKVLLSASSDLSLNIISATPPSDSNSLELLAVPRVLKGHKAGITDTAIIGVGRRVLSCAKDGTVRLWDVGKGEKISTLASERFAPIVKMAMSGRIPSSAIPPEPVETADSQTDVDENVIYAALQNGAFNVFDLRTRNLIYASPTSRISSSSKAALGAIAVDDSSYFLATGSQGGFIRVYDSRYLPPQSLFTFQRSNSSIEDLHFVPSKDGEGAPQLLVATGDGFPFCASLHPDGPKVAEELVGFADESVTVIRTDGKGAVWAAGHDGIVRKY
ncbi:WD40-repeat-containing domain protein [Cantharellus anzutake]|uniref:WD40-repeat-containing domain protein n=1 Tax=Cantharellus anzutake TaxID=1750568 RepID=UPI001905B7C8|nr:WD40-repeat-containing domain protein [Cantharellus anzutake]KAF8339178.1 WD40-repeat-containing domain protein [Cantharellus anzutake]